MLSELDAGIFSGLFLLTELSVGLIFSDILVNIIRILAGNAITVIPANFGPWPSSLLMLYAP